LLRIYPVNFSTFTESNGIMAQMKETLNPTEAKDKYKAMWISHSSISDFLKCPRLYYLRNMYKDPKTGHKITVMTPHLALGQMVHEVIEGLSVVPVGKRMSLPLVSKLESSWVKVAGDKGGFKTAQQESEFKERGITMLKNLEKNPGPIMNKAIKIKSESGLPFYWFNEEENTILCGKIDWIEYLEETDSIHVIDFKTGKYDESPSSLQLPIYLLLANNLQRRKVEKASYWYLNRENGLNVQTLPSAEEAYEKISQIASRIKEARKTNQFKCPDSGCKHCASLEEVVKGKGKFVGLSEYRQDIYILK